MFSTQKDYQNMDNKQLLLELISEMDEVKRYVANIHQNTDSEVGEMHQMMKQMERQLKETDDQIDKIERFERTMNDIKSSLKQLEKKIR